MLKTNYPVPTASARQSGSQRPTIHGRLVIAGQILPDFRKFAITPEKAQEIGSALLHTIDFADVVLLILVGWLALPAARLVHGIYHSKRMGQALRSSEPEKSAPTVSDDDMIEPDPFLSTYTFHVAETVSQIAKIAMIVYLIDCVIIVLYMAGVDFIMDDIDIGAKVAKILYTIWAAFRLMAFKRYLLGLAVNKSADKLGKVVVYDRILDIIIYASLWFAILDTANIAIGAGLTSLFAFGGVGTLVFSLASKDLAILLVSGVALSTSEKFHEGEEIKLGDDTRGIVNHLGWLYTEIRGSDEIIVKIPNSQLANQRVSNISRIKKCQVKQTLWFRYDDIKRIPALIQDIKDDIVAGCPKLITDGTRPFRVHWRDFKEDHLEVVVDAHFNLPPSGNAYWDNRQKVLEAIAVAVEKNNITFAIPAYHVIEQKYQADGLQAGK